MLSFGANESQRTRRRSRGVLRSRAAARAWPSGASAPGICSSKHRFLSLQFDAFLKNDCWLRLARHANAMTDRLAAGLAAAGQSAVWPVEANLVFIALPKAVEARLKATGAQFYVRHSESLPGNIKLGPDQCLIRLVTSFATRAAEVDSLRGTCRKGVTAPPQRCPIPPPMLRPGDSRRGAIEDLEEFP